MRRLVALLALTTFLGAAVPARANYFNPVKRLKQKMEKKAREATDVEESPQPQPSGQPPNNPQNPSYPGYNQPGYTGQSAAPGTKGKPGPRQGKKPAGKPVTAHSPAAAKVRVMKGLIRIIQGTVQIKARLSKNWQPVYAGVVLEDGDELQTGPPGSAFELGFTDGSIVRLEQFTKVLLRGGKYYGVKLYIGKITAHLSHNPANIAVYSPTGTVRGRDAVAEVSMDADDTLVAVSRGTVTVTGEAGQGVQVPAGQFSAVPPKSKAAQPRALKYLQERLGTSGPALAPKVIIVDRNPLEVLKGQYTVEVDGLLKPVEFIEFEVDGAVEFVANDIPYRYNLNTHLLSNGTHLLRAIVHWADNTKINTDELKVEVRNEGASPLPSPGAPSPAAS